MCVYFCRIKSLLGCIFMAKSLRVGVLLNSAGLRKIFGHFSGRHTPVNSQLKCPPPPGHGFKDTATDKCVCKEGIEDTLHYFLVCPFYANHRLVLKSEIEKILHNNEITEFNFSVDLFLYGHPSLDCSENRKVIAHTLEYIKNTNRLAT